MLRGGGGRRRGDGRDGHGARGVVSHGGSAAHHVRVAVPICEVGRLEVAGRGRGSVHGRGGGRGGSGGSHGALLVVVMVVVVVLLQKVVVRGVVGLSGSGGCGGRGRNLVRRGGIVVRCRRRREMRRLRRRRWGRREHRRRSVACCGSDVVALMGHAAAEGRHGGDRVVACTRVGDRLIVAVIREDRVFPVNLRNAKFSDEDKKCVYLLSSFRSRVA